MADDNLKTRAAGVFQCEGLAFALLYAFAERLTADVEEAGGAVSVDRINAAVRTFATEEAEQFRIDFRERLEDYMVTREKEIWDQTRKRPFDRVLVKRFSHLFATDGNLGEEGAPLSRRLLPGFFNAMEKMAGPELFNQCQGACKGILKAKRDARKEGGEGSDVYEELYDTAEANDLVDDVLIVVASHFEDFDTRVDWLNDLINAKLANPDDYEFEGRPVFTWELERHHLLDLLRGLFQRLRDKLESDSGAEEMQERYGRRARVIIEGLLTNLDAAD